MKNKNLIVRLDERDSIMLDEVCKYFEFSKSDLIRNYIKELFWYIKAKNSIKEEP